MAEVHILRNHELGVQEARKIGLKWAQAAESEFGMTCSYQEGLHCDELSFSRPGVKGKLFVRADEFELRVQLGFLLSAFKERIEVEIVKNLDDLLRA